MKRLFSVLLCVVILASSFVVNASAVATVSVNNVSCEAGNTIEMFVVLENCSGFANLELEIGYDTSVMTLENVASANVGATFVKAQSNDKNPYNMSWTSMENVSYNGTLATLTFSVAKNAISGTYPVTVSFYKGINGNYTDGYDVNIDENFEPLNLVYTNGSVTIDGVEPVVEVSDVELNATELEMEVGNEVVLEATVMPENATDKTVVWKSDNEEVATVENGVVTAVSAGEATITATAGGKSASCVVTVKEPVVEVSEVTLNVTELEMEVGNEVVLEATVMPENATDKTVVWESDNEEVATVENGVVTAVSAGEATITATTGGKSASCVVTVKEPVFELPYVAGEIIIDANSCAVSVFGEFVKNENSAESAIENGDKVVVMVSYLKNGAPFAVTAVEITVKEGKIVIPIQKMTITEEATYSVAGISVLKDTTALEAVSNGNLGTPVAVYTAD